MGWERRERGGWYYTRSRKVNGKVRREYVGAGLAGELAASLDAEDRAEKEAEAEAWRAERERLGRIDTTFGEMFDLVEQVARANLMAAGYRRHHRGAWRRKREKGTHSSEH